MPRYVVRHRVLVAPHRSITLNPHHAPTVYATLCEAYGLATGGAPVLPDGTFVEAPEQARVRVEKNEPLAFGWTMLSVDPRDARLRCQRLIAGLQKLGALSPSKSKPLHGGFEVLEVYDVLQDRPVKPDDSFSGVPVSSKVAFADLTDEAIRVSLQIRTPLRIRRPNRAAQENHGFLDQQWFCLRRWFRSLDRRLREMGLDELCPDSTKAAIALNLAAEPELSRDHLLTWLDLPYQGRGGKKSLGGVVGRLTLPKVHRDWLPALFWGQLFGIGRNTAMGLGRYHVQTPCLRLEPEHCSQEALVQPLARSGSLLSYAFAPEHVDESAARYRLPVGQALAAVAAIRRGTYRPDKPQRFVLHDGDKRPRPMVVPSRRDRALQVALLQTLTPAIERFLETSSFAYRKGLSRYTAAKRIQALSRQGYRWAVRSDIHRFFDSVDHSLLRARLEAYLADPPLVELLMTWVRSSAQILPAACASVAEQPENGWEPSQPDCASDNSVGLPTGAPLSPVLANLLLDLFDEAVEHSGAKLVRYADDFVLLHQSESQANASFEVARRAAQSLLLQLNQDKTHVHSPQEDFEFLGFRFQRERDWRFHNTLPPSEIDALNWVDLNDPQHPLQQCSEIEFRLPGETDQRSHPCGVLVLSGRVAAIDATSNALLIELRRGKVRRMRLRNLHTIVALKSIALSAAAVDTLIRHQIDLLVAERSGHAAAQLVTQHPARADTWRRQLDQWTHAGYGLPLARQLVFAKVSNTASLCESLFQDREAVEVRQRLMSLSQSCQEAECHEQLLGYEGAAAAAWYGLFGKRLPSEFQFASRVSPRARDPANALLNVAHMHVYRLSSLAARQAGLLPEIGVLHRPRSGHNALASDLQEPFRHLADRVVWMACLEFSERDFRIEENARYPLTISSRAMRRLFQSLHQSIGRFCHDAAGVNGSYRDHLFRQARNLRSSLDQPAQRFEAFLHPR